MGVAARAAERVNVRRAAATAEDHEEEEEEEKDNGEDDADGNVRGEAAASGQADDSRSSHVAGVTWHKASRKWTARHSVVGRRRRSASTHRC